MYPPMEKLAFVLVTAARKLKPYFQAHRVIVLTDRPLRRAMCNPKATGQMALWAIELSKFNIQYCRARLLKDKLSLTSSQNSPAWKDRRQKSVQGGLSTRTDCLTDRSVELVWFSTVQKGTKLNAWSGLISPQPITRRSTKP